MIYVSSGVVPLPNCCEKFQENNEMQFTAMEEGFLESLKEFEKKNPLCNFGRNFWDIYGRICRV